MINTKDIYIIVELKITIGRGVCKKMPEARKLQRLGNTTLVVSIPKKWADRYRLKRGDMVYVDIDESGYLKVIPQDIRHEGSTQNTYTIEIDQEINSNLIERLITSCYILGYDRITIKVIKGKINGQILEGVRRTISEHTGVGILEQNEKSIILQCFIDVKRFPMNKLMKRIMDNVLSVIDLLMRTVEEKNPTLLKDLKNIKTEIDRFFCLGIRQMVMSQIDWSVARAAEIESTIHLLGNRAIFNSIKIIGNALNELSSLIAEIFIILESQNTFYEKIKETLINLSDITKLVFEAFQRKSLLKANYALDRILEFENKEVSFVRDLLSETCRDVDIASKVIVLNNRTMQIIKELETICRVTINRVIEENPESLIISKERSTISQNSS